MRVITEAVEGGRVITVIGELDAASASKLIAEIDRREPDPERLILDLTEMSFMDSSGLGAILYAWTRMSESGGRLALVCPMDAHVRRSFKIRGVAERLTVVDTREEALALK